MSTAHTNITIRSHRYDAGGENLRPMHAATVEQAATTNTGMRNRKSVGDAPLQISKAAGIVRVETAAAKTMPIPREKALRLAGHSMASHRSVRTDSSSFFQIVTITIPLNSKNTPPMLIVHGDADAIVPFEHAKVLESALKTAGVPVQVYVVMGGNHGVAGAGEPGSVARAAAFMRSQLLGQESK